MLHWPSAFTSVPRIRPRRGNARYSAGEVNGNGYANGNGHGQGVNGSGKKMM